ncbi:MULTISPECIES: hypothetical protein [Peribacillus]|uniref:hypothetical protein n=1 Tax=Peribacillus TaxID=2675229 RepID=UPI000BA77FC6|nr:MULTISPECIES: hypothetical protein [Peribacillus]MBD8591239.1 hypothetical protein [Peribacillus simplex]MCM3170357.1 hypothetical protein [Peribacillus frigoritolerans]MEE3955789.1 hypothetical protein [Peribacillus frigoritolerans]PAL14716.1 hypothetical protein B8W99_04640 [Peribacillus simplex]
MKKVLKIQVLLSIVIILSFFNFDVSNTEAAYSDNPNGVYHKLSDIVYRAQGTASDVTNMQKRLDDSGFLGAPGKYKVIDVIDVDNERNHPMATVAKGSGTHTLDKTGLKAMAVAIPGSKKLFLVFAGSENLIDFKTAYVSVSETSPGQSNQAQLYMNYIYKKFPTYASYNWYLTGHSLGGWVSTKLYLDIRSARWLTSATKFKYGGAINKSISGVFTFNTLPISKKNISSEQWNANLNGAYSNAVKNLYIANEWLNNTQKIHQNDLAYIGTKGSIDTGVPYTKLITTGIYDTLVTFATYKTKTSAHSLCSLKNSVTPINKTCNK